MIIPKPSEIPSRKTTEKRGTEATFSILDEVEGDTDEQLACLDVAPVLHDAKIEKKPFVVKPHLTDRPLKNNPILNQFKARLAERGQK